MILGGLGLGAELAWAQAAGAAVASEPSTLEMLALPIAFFLLMYILLIRPQAKKFREQKHFQETLKVGADVITTGGLMAQVQEIKENKIVLDIGCGVVQVLRDHVLPYPLASKALGVGASSAVKSHKPTKSD